MPDSDREFWARAAARWTEAVRAGDTELARQLAPAGTKTGAAVRHMAAQLQAQRDREAAG